MAPQHSMEPTVFRSAGQRLCDQPPDPPHHPAAGHAGTPEDVPIQEKGWREAVYAFYPITINEFKIDDADVTYVDQDPSKPLHFTHLNFLAGNIRNIRSPKDAYPSDLNLEGTYFGSGRIEMKGHANFLAEPHAGINADLGFAARRP